MNDSDEAILCYGIPLTREESVNIRKCFSRLIGFKSQIPGLDDDFTFADINLVCINEMRLQENYPTVTEVDVDAIMEVVTALSCKTGIPAGSCSNLNDSRDQLITQLQKHVGLSVDFWRCWLHQPPQDILDQYNREVDAWIKSHQLPFEVVCHNRNMIPMYILALRGTVSRSKWWYPEKIKPPLTISKRAQEIKKTREFCKKHNLKADRAGWWLCSYLESKVSGDLARAYSVAVLCYGVPIFDDIGTISKWWKRVMFKPQISGFDDMRTYVGNKSPLTIGQKFWERERAWEKSHPFPFTVVFYGRDCLKQSHEQEHILTLPDTVFEAPCGVPKRIQKLPNVSRRGKEIGKIDRFCKKHHLNIGEAGWWLCSSDLDQESRRAAPWS